MNTNEIPWPKGGKPVYIEPDADDDSRDGVLFRLWIRLAASHPGTVAKHLAPCLSESDYRRALIQLAREFKINLP